MAHCAFMDYGVNVVLGMALTPLLLFAIYFLSNRMTDKLNVKITDVIAGGAVEGLIKLLECSGMHR